MNKKVWIGIGVVGLLVIAVVSLVVPFTHAGKVFAQSDMAETVSVENTFMDSFSFLGALFVSGLFVVFIIVDGDEYLSSGGKNTR